MGGGTAVAPLTTSTADAKFVEFRTETTAASGDNRLMYLRYALEGAGGGEAMRASTVVNENVGTAHGAHFGIEFEAGADASECSGLGVGLRGTLMIPNVASWAPTGTYAAGMFEIYSVGSESDPAGMTELSVLRLLNANDATGREDVDTDAFLLSIQGFSSGATNMLYDANENAIAQPNGSIKIKIGNDTRYLYYWDGAVTP